MPRSALELPNTDPTPIFEAFRGNHATELLTAAVAHLGVFARLSAGPLGSDDLQRDLGLAERPVVVLLTVLKALRLVSQGEDGRLGLTDLAQEHLVPGAPFDVSEYLGLAAGSPGVVEMVERLRSNRPAGGERDEPG